MDALRKVQFTYYLKNGEYITAENPKIGFFHKWIEERESEGGVSVVTTFALVEDSETGEIFKVVPVKMTFVPIQIKLK